MLCVLDDLKAHTPFSISNVPESYFIQQDIKEYEYADNNSLIWYDNEMKTFSYILPPQSQLNVELKNPEMFCPSYSPSLQSSLKCNGYTWDGNKSPIIKNDGTTVTCDYTQAVSFTEDKIIRTSTHMIYQMVMERGAVVSNKVEMYFDRDEKKIVDKDTWSTNKDVEFEGKPRYVQMMKLSIQVFALAGNKGLDLVDEVFEIEKGHCYSDTSSDTRDLLKGEIPIGEDHTVRGICNVYDLSCMNMKLKRKDDNTIIAQRRFFFFNDKANTLQFPNLNPVTHSIEDNPYVNYNENVDPDKLKTLKVRWKTGEGIARSIFNGKPTFKTLFVFRILRNDANITTVDEEIKKEFFGDGQCSIDSSETSTLEENESDKKTDENSVKYCKLLKNFLDNGYGVKILENADNEFVFGEDDTELKNGDQVSIKLFTQYYEDMSTDTSEKTAVVKKRIRFMYDETQQFDDIDVCLPTHPVTSNLMITPGILFAEDPSKVTVFDNTLSFLFYRPQTAVSISLNQANLLVCDKKTFVDLFVDDSFYRSEFHESGESYNFNVTLQLNRGEQQINIDENADKSFPQLSLQLVPSRRDTSDSNNEASYNGDKVTIKGDELEVIGTVNQHTFNLFKVLPHLYKCYIPVPNKPTLVKHTIYHRCGSESGEVPFNPSGNLYNDCVVSTTNKAYNKYILQYQLVNDDEPKRFATEIPAEKGDSGEQKFKLDKEFLSVPGIYSYHVIAANLPGEEVSSSSGTLHVCSNTTLAEGAKSDFVIQEPNKDTIATVKNLYFKWKTPMELMSLRCNANEKLSTILTISKKSSGKSARREVVLRRTLSPTLQEYRLTNFLLDLSSDYTWSLEMEYKKSESDSPMTFETGETSFTTVNKHCAYMTCIYGTCDEETTKCVCFNGYSGSSCDISTTTTGAIVGIVVGIVVGVLVVLAVIFIGIRHNRSFQLRKSEFKKYMFFMPENVISSTGRVDLNSIEDKIRSDPQNEFEWAISLFRNAKGDEPNELSKAFIYAFERYGNGLAFLTRLVRYEIDNAKYVNTLFRNNSFATKCFHVYAQMVGLPYLYHVAAPLFRKLIKDEHLNTMRIAVSGNNKSFDNVDFTQQHQVGFEINPTMDEDLDEDYIITNALVIQLSCQVFINSLNSSKEHCPHEFEKLCNYIKHRFSEKFPDSDVSQALSAFMFLRYLIFGISFPESCGLVKIPPSEEMRRQLILISKVLSAWSTNTKFDEKEEYMVIMNDFISEHESTLKAYYDHISRKDYDEITPTAIPQKYYLASIELIGAMDEEAKKRHGNSENKKSPKKAKREGNKKKSDHRPHKKEEIIENNKKTETGEVLQEKAVEEEKIMCPEGNNKTEELDENDLENNKSDSTEDSLEEQNPDVQEKESLRDASVNVEDSNYTDENEKESNTHNSEEEKEDDAVEDRKEDNLINEQEKEPSKASSTNDDDSGDITDKQEEESKKQSSEKDNYSLDTQEKELLNEDKSEKSHDITDVSNKNDDAKESPEMQTQENKKQAHSHSHHHRHHHHHSKKKCKF